MTRDRNTRLASFIGFLAGAYAGFTVVLFLIIPLFMAGEHLQEARSIFLFFTAAPRGAIVFSVLIILLCAIVGTLLSYGIVMRNLLKEQERRLSAALQSNKSKDEFISMILHHLRTPLSGIRWGLKELLKQFTGNEAEKQDLSRLAEENSRALNAVEHLIEASQASLERLTYNFKIITIAELNELIKKSIEIFKLNAKAKELSLGIEMGSSSHNSVKVDKEKVVIIVQTLLENAIAYTDQGGLIRTRTEEKGSDFLFHIADTGIGIPEKDKSKIFRHFFRGEQARALEPAGFGIGLFIARVFLRHHNGDIWFVSQKKGGTTFSFKLPIITAATEKILGKI